MTAFGAFVDIGVHQDGLVHISQLADRFVKDAHEVVKVNQRVTVTVLEVDVARKRISLSMKGGRLERPTKGTIKGPDGKQKAPVDKRPKPGPFNNPFTKAFGK